MLKQTLEQTILRVGEQNKRFQLAQVSTELGGEISRQYISEILRDMVRRGILLREGGGRYTFYALPEHSSYLPNRIHRSLLTDGLEEHKVLEMLEREAAFINKLPDNTGSIVTYAFSEMLNNAIDHSSSPKADVSFAQSEDKLTFEVRDWGVGVFRNIQHKHKLASELEAIQELLKGKTTTAPQAHSGEGIFFTSKVADKFALDSFGFKLQVDNIVSDVFIEETRLLKGTRVQFEINLHTTKHLSDIFSHFQTDSSSYGFDKTEIMVKLYTMGTVHVSRSQARRVMTGLPQKFKSVMLDFDKVPTVGQAFADEVFRVYKTKYPHLSINYTNANKTVQFMIDRVHKPP